MPLGILGWLLVQKNWGNGDEDWSLVTAVFQFWLLSCDEHTVTQDINNCEIGGAGYMRPLGTVSCNSSVNRKLFQNKAFI